MTLRLVVPDPGNVQRDERREHLERDILIAAGCVERAKERLNELLCERDRLLLEGK